MSQAPLRTRQRPVASPSAVEYRCKYVSVGIDEIKPGPRRIRKHPRGKLEKVKSTVVIFDVVTPILVDRQNRIIDGHLLWEALKELGYQRVHIVRADHLTDAQVEAYRLALHHLQESAVLDDAQAKLSLEFIIKNDPALINPTLMPMGKVDGLLLSGFSQANDDSPVALGRTSHLRLGDRFVFAAAEGKLAHSLTCGDAKNPNVIMAALSARTVQMLLSDVPYGLVPIKGVVSGKHEDFVEGASMTEAEAIPFFIDLLKASVDHVVEGGAVYLFIDHRGMYGLTQATRGVGLSHICTVAWDKQAGGMGGLYRHQIEFVLVLAKGKRIAVNNVQLGKHGRNRTTLWSSGGMAQFGGDRKAALDAHPTVKPVQLLAEAILDVTNRGDVVLDPCMGTGSTIVAANRVGRVGVGVEIDPVYFEVAVRRLQAVVGSLMVHEATGLTLDALIEQRAGRAGAAAE